MKHSLKDQTLDRLYSIISSVESSDDDELKNLLAEVEDEFDPGDDYSKMMAILHMLLLDDIMDDNS